MNSKKKKKKKKKKRYWLYLWPRSCQLDPWWLKLQPTALASEYNMTSANRHGLSKKT